MDNRCHGGGCGNVVQVDCWAQRLSYIQVDGIARDRLTITGIAHATCQFVSAGEVVKTNYTPHIGICFVYCLAHPLQRYTKETVDFCCHDPNNQNVNNVGWLLIAGWEYQFPNYWCVFVLLFIISQYRPRPCCIITRTVVISSFSHFAS